MIVRAKNMMTGKEVNINVNQIVSFEPSGDDKNSLVQLSNGMNVTVDLSNRSLRHAIKVSSQKSDDD